MKRYILSKKNANTPWSNFCCGWQFTAINTTGTIWIKITNNKAVTSIQPFLLFNLLLIFSLILFFLLLLGWLLFKLSTTFLIWLTDSLTALFTELLDVQYGYNYIES